MIEFREFPIGKFGRRLAMPQFTDQGVPACTQPPASALLQGVAHRMRRAQRISLLFLYLLSLPLALFVDRTARADKTCGRRRFWTIFRDHFAYYLELRFCVSMGLFILCHQIIATCFNRCIVKDNCSTQDTIGQCYRCCILRTSESSHQRLCWHVLLRTCGLERFGC